MNNEIIKINLINKLTKLKIKYNFKHILMFEKFLFLLKKENQKFNLTSIINDIDIINKHFIDSIYIMTKISFVDKLVLDFGTGAGFPGLPLSILNSKANFLLLDSNKKKINFINNTIKKLLLNNCRTKCLRMEEYNYKEKYDIIITRAVSNLLVISELAIPFLKLNGYFIAMKSIHCDKEILKSKNHIIKLGALITDIYDYAIPNTNIIHRIIMIKKIKHTESCYPRNYSKIISESQLKLKI